MSRINRKVQSSGSAQVMNRNMDQFNNHNFISIRSNLSAKPINQDNEILNQSDELIENINDNQTKLPQLTELINLKIKPQDKELHSKIIEIVAYAQDLENQLKFKNKHIERLEYMIKFFTIGQQKRDIMVQLIQDENRKLKEQLNLLEQQLKRQEIDFTAQPKKPEMTKSLNKLPNQSTNSNSNIVKLLPNQIRQPPPPQNRLLLRTKTKEIQDEIAHGLLSLEIENQPKLATRYNQIPHISPLTQTLGNSYNQFEKNVTTMNTPQYTQLFDALHQTLAEHKQLFHIVGRLRMLINTAVQLSQQPSLQQALEIVIADSCEVLESDRSSVFVYDPEKEQLWTRVSKGSQIIRIPYNKGIAGHVFTSGELLNVMNAYSDPRFDKEADKHNNYRTNTILAIPIMDPSKQNTIGNSQLEFNLLIGVLQAINKISGYFSKDDEKMIDLVSQLAGISLKNALQFDEAIIYHNSLRHLVTIQEKLCGIVSMSQFLQEAEQQLRELFNVQYSKVYIVKQEKMCRFDEKEYSIEEGLIGDAIKNKSLINTFQPYSSKLFNKMVDIETTLPLYSFAIKNPHNPNQVVAALQVINQKAIQSVSTQQKHKIASLDYEILSNFGSFLAKKILSIK